MLTYEELKSTYKTQGGTTPNVSAKNILVEYLQHEILDSLYKQKGSELLSFMGGTAIRICYKGNRFSEDLDFDNFGLSYEAFQDMLALVVKDMEHKGFLVEFRFSEQGAFHCFVKFPKILSENGVSGHTEEKILIRIDTVRKEKIFNPDVYTINAFDLYRDILVNPAPIILSQKLITIIERKREKGRDFYDTSFLYGRAEPDFAYIQNITGQSREEFTEKLFARCRALDFDILARDIEPFLTHPKDAERVRMFERFITQKLGGQ
jgi:predicted nucleotidyltransferase component of viral defense system